MGLYINTNLAAINARRHLDRQTVGLRQVHERLASGLRINSAGDDAAGTAISDRLTTRVRGLAQANRNAADAVSLVQVAEGAMMESTQILQRMRELSVQAASDMNTTADREAIQAEIDQLIDELDRVGETTRMNGERLLDGGFIEKFFHVGSDFRERTRVSLSDARASALGRWAVATSAEVFHNQLVRGDLILNQVTIRGSYNSDDLLSTTLMAGSAIAKAAAINDTTAFHGVQAYVNATIRLGSGDVVGGALDEANYIKINERIITGITIEPEDASDALIRAINAEFEHTGVTARLDANSQVELRAEDGRNLDVVIYGNADVITGLATDTAAGTLTLHSADQIAMSGANEVRAGFVDNALIGVSGAQATSTVDVRSREGANLAILIMDRALEHLNAERATLGAIHNRLTTTQSHLTHMGEALEAARSRILDADFAAESAQLSRLQVLQQA
ncbi:flagellin, partial [Myxococcota bacterium]|nr:flagellin [Myxococcota bacterium]